MRNTRDEIPDYAERVRRMWSLTHLRPAYPYRYRLPALLLTQRRQLTSTTNGHRTGIRRSGCRQVSTFAK
jgi:hypothetical protein